MSNQKRNHFTGASKKSPVDSNISNPFVKEKCEHNCKRDTIKKNKLLHDMKSIAYLLELFKQEFDRFHEDLEDMTNGKDATDSDKPGE